MLQVMCSKDIKRICDGTCGYLNCINRAMHTKTPEEIARDIGVPVIPRLPPDRQLEINRAIAVCGECGMVIRENSSYSCGNMRCPVQLKSFAL